MSKVEQTSMAYVGRFTEQDLKERKDRMAIDAKKKIFPSLKYIYSKEVKKGKKIVALDVWITDEFMI